MRKTRLFHSCTLNKSPLLDTNVPKALLMTRYCNVHPVADKLRKVWNQTKVPPKDLLRTS